jgi:hypothetical protein
MSGHDPRPAHSDILQCDGADTVSELSSNQSICSDITEYDTEDEAYNEHEPAVLVPAHDQPDPGEPLVLMVDDSGRMALPASLPLVMLTNARSIYNKIDNFIKWLLEIFPDCAMVSETWEHEGRRVTLEDLLVNTPYKVLSYRRTKGRKGGCCAIIYNETKFKVEQVNVDKDENIESVWAMFTPRNLDHKLQKIKRVCISSIYIAPRSEMKSETMAHIIQTIHLIRSKFDNQVNFIIGGDVNKTDYSDVIDSYGALKQCVTVGTRNQATLEIILSDLMNLYHPPTTLDPLQVDEDKIGKDSDHKIVIYAPKSDVNFKVKRKKKVIKTRPIPDSKIHLFGKDIQSQTWDAILNEPDLDTKVYYFHTIIVGICDKYFPEKTITISNLDKKWITPELKTLSRNIKREFFRKRKSSKWKKLKIEFKKKKRKAIQTFHYNFVNDLKGVDPGKFYKMCKRIGAVDDINDGDLHIDSLEGLTDDECAEAVGQHMAAISNEYEPVNLEELPAYLPAQPPPKVEEYEVYDKLKRLKNTKSTLPIDIPNKLRKEVMVELVKPLTHIINACLFSGYYPALWKREWVSPVPKVKEPDVIKDMRKIACTSDYNKVLEAFLKDIMVEDVLVNIDPKQYGGKKGIGTEHMVVALMDRVLSLLDDNNTKSAVIMAGADWAGAFDRGDPTKTTKKLIALGLRSSIVPLIISYMSGRVMTVKFNQGVSSIISLCGGFPQGSLIGQDCYLASSHDAADHVDPDDRFRYIDDLQILEMIILSGILSDYNVHTHVPSDIPLDHRFLQGSSTRTQANLDQIAQWTDQNDMELNTAKCNYILFSRSKEDFVTRLTVNGIKIDQKEVTKILGCWIDQDAGKWSTNTKELCKSAYSRVSMLTKLRYIGVSTEDLLDIYRLFVRSRAEYMSVLWHSSLTIKESHKIENIQKTSLKVILQESYIDYLTALEMTGLSLLSVRRQVRCLTFAKRCLKNPDSITMFPVNPEYTHDLRNVEKYHVNFAHTENYKKSAVPYCQRLLNLDHSLQGEVRKQQDRKRARCEKNDRSWTRREDS